MIHAIFQQEMRRITNADVIVKLVYNTLPFEDLANDVCPDGFVLGFYGNKRRYSAKYIQHLFEGHNHLIAINAKHNKTSSSCICTLWHEEAHLNQFRGGHPLNEFKAQYYTLRKAFQLSQDLNSSDPLRDAVQQTKGWLDLDNPIYVHAAQNIKLTKLWQKCVDFLQILKYKSRRAFGPVEIEQIRNAYHNGTTNTSLSRTWGVSPTTIHNIVNYKTYKDVITTELRQ